jgi:hypothetical protein
VAYVVIRKTKAACGFTPDKENPCIVKRWRGPLGEVPCQGRRLPVGCMVEARDRIVVSDSDRGPSTEQGNVREGTFGNGKRRAERHRGYAGGRPPDIDVGGKDAGNGCRGTGREVF